MMSRIRVTVILVTVAFVAFLGGGLLYLKARIEAEQFRHLAERTLTRQLNHPVRIGSMSLSLLHRRLELRQIAVGTLSAESPAQAGRKIEAPLLTVDHASVTFRPTSLLRGVPQVRSLVIHGPRLQLTDSPASSATLIKLVSSLSEISTDRGTEGFPVSLEQGTVAYRDTTSSRSFQITGLQGRLVWPSPSQAVVVMATDNLAAQIGVHTLQNIRLQADVRLTRDGVQVEQLNLGKAGSSLAVTGIVHTGTDRSPIELNVTGQLDPQALASRFGGVAPWRGPLIVKGKIAGEAGSRTLTAGLVLEDATGRRVGQTDVAVQSGVLTVKRLSLYQGVSRLAADGTINLQTMAADLNLDLRGRLEDAVRWFPMGTAVTGPIIARVRLTGPPSNLNGIGRLEMRQLGIGTERIEALEATVAIKENELTIPSLTARYDGIPFKASAAIEGGGNYRFVVSPTKVEIASIRALVDRGVRGALLVSLSGTGQWPERHVEGDLAFRDLVYHDLKIGHGRVRFALDDNRWRWELTGSRTLRATGVAPLWLSGPIQAEISASDLNLEPLLQALHARLRFPLTAWVDGRARVRGTLPGLGDLTGRIDLTALRGIAGSTPFGLRQPTRALLRPDSLRVDSLQLIGVGLSVTLTGGFEPGGRLNLSLSGHVPFDVIRPWIPAVSDLRGAPPLQLSLSGEPGAIRATGRAELAHIQVKPTIIPIWIAIGAGEITFSNDRVHYIATEGTLADSPLKGEGTARREGEVWHHALEFNVDHASVDLINDQLLPERRWVSGTLSTRAALAFETAPNRAAIPTLQGQLSVRLQDGSLAHYPAMVRLIGLLGAPTQPYRLPDLARERMPYRRISADIEVKNGVLHTTNLLLDSEVMRLSATGQMTLADQRVDLDLAVRPLQVLEQGIRRLPLLGRLLPTKQSLAITYFDMTGPWDDPSITIAPVKSLSQTARDLLRFLLLAPWRAVAPPY